MYSPDGAIFGMLLSEDLFIGFFIIKLPFVPKVWSIRKVWIQSFDHYSNTLPRVG